MDFAVSADHRLELKESEKINKYLNFAREVRKFSLIWFYGISALVGYLMPNPF